MTVRIANGAGFLGDDLDAPRRLVETAHVDYLTLEFLAELTISFLARAREKNPDAGFAQDFLEVLRSLLPALAEQPTLHIVTNAGGMNPRACARQASEILKAAGLEATRIGVVTGDDLLARMEELQAAGCRFEHTDTGQPLAEAPGRIVSVNAYLGAQPIQAALQQDARIVITGRVADASLTLGPAIHECGWSWTDWDRLAAGTIAGHLIECGAQITGGYSTEWRDREVTLIGYPIAELEPDGTTVITKPHGSGGCVTRKTVVEQLVYEIGDPRSYLTPDVVADFTSVEVTESGPDRVVVRGARGRAAPESYKVSAAYHAGYFAAQELLVFGQHAAQKARRCAELICKRLQAVGVELAETNVELLSLGAAVPIPGLQRRARSYASELVLRIAAFDPRREAVERFTREFAPLITNGPAGLAGYAAGRASVRPVFAYWPGIISKELVMPEVSVQSVQEWLR